MFPDTEDSMYLKQKRISPKENHKTDVRNDKEPILNYINKFKNHLSIKFIKSRKKEEQTFTFNHVSYE